MEPLPKSYELLLIEDNPGDVELIRRCLQHSGVANHLSVVEDGMAATAFLQREGPAYAQAPRPDLILLDLNLPRKDGRKVLAEIKANPDLVRIPVIVLTSSTLEADVCFAYDLCATCYITKPVTYEEFQQVCNCLLEFWFRTVRLPHR
jgi:two-component system, chemotaxis family, response regulator Rcp1